MRTGIFFGASVTAQSKGNGYCDLVKQLLEPAGLRVLAKGFGACHFDDAGFFYSRSLLDHDPAFVILEWNTTGLTRFHTQKFNYVLRMLAHAKVPVGFLVLPRTDKNVSGDRDCERQVAEAARKHGLPVLDLRGKVDLKACLRDAFHTNPTGAEIYAGLIAEWIRDEFLPGKRDFSKFFDFGIGSDGELESIRPFQLDGLANKRLGRQLVLVLEGKSDALFDVAVSATIGPQSPVVMLQVSGGGHVESKLSIFDPWCHYERTMMFSFWPKGVSVKPGELYVLEVDVLDEPPDYSICKQAGFAYTGPRYVDMHEVCAAGFDVRFMACR